MRRAWGVNKRVAATVEREMEREIRLNDRPSGVTEMCRHIKARRHCSGDRVGGSNVNRIGENLRGPRDTAHVSTAHIPSDLLRMREREIVKKKKKTEIQRASLPSSSLCLQP